MGKIAAVTVGDGREQIAAVAPGFNLISAMRGKSLPSS